MNSQMRSRLLWAALFITPAIVTFLVERQGFNMLDDGLWALGTRVVANGGLLYRDIFTVYGPAQYYALLPFFWIFGESARTLVLFKAVLAGCSSMLGFYMVRRYGARRLGWLIPLAILAIGPVSPRYVCAAAFAALHSEVFWRTNRQFTNGLLLGIAWGCLSLFGLDMLLCGAIIVFAGQAFTCLLASNVLTFRDRRLRGALAGFAGTLAIALLFAAATGTLTRAVWDTIVCPLAHSPHHVTLNILENFFRPLGMDTAFSQVFTGEILGPAWPGHVTLRVIAIRMIVGLVFAAPCLALVARRRPVDPRLGSLFALALSSWVVVIWRNDVAHIFAAFYCTLFVVVCLLGAIRAERIPVSILSVALLGAAMAPFAGERLWLLAHANRSSLVQWERPTAGIAMAKNRQETIERVIDTLSAGNESPTIGWPAQPGLAFLSGQPLATSQVTLLAGSVRDEATVIAELRKSGPAQLVLGRTGGLAPGARSVDELAPSIWKYLRANYFVELQIADGAEGFQVIRNADKSGVALEQLPLERRLPGTSQLVKNAQTPPLSPNMVISQAFRVGGIDLHGIVLLMATTGSLPTEVDLAINVEELLANGSTQSLAVLKSRVPLDQRAQLRTLAFPTIPQTAGKMVVLHFSATPNPGHEVRLLWHDTKADKSVPVDYYPEGHAMLDGRPVDADLFFISY